MGSDSSKQERRRTHASYEYSVNEIIQPYPEQVQSVHAQPVYAPSPSQQTAYSAVDEDLQRAIRESSAEYERSLLQNCHSNNTCVETMVQGQHAPSMTSNTLETPVTLQSQNVPSPNNNAASVTVQDTLSSPASSSSAGNSQSPLYNSPASLCGRSDGEEFVFVNNFQRLRVPPSAPPAPFDNVNNNRSRQMGNQQKRVFQNLKAGARNRVNNDDETSCPTCKSRLGLVIFQCGDGHSSCQNCRQGNRRCGKCGKAIGDLRNIPLEAYLAEKRVPCDNASASGKGCTLHFKLADMESHLKECPFSKTLCPIGKIFGHCNWQGQALEMVSHFDSFHKAHRAATIDQEMYIFNITCDSYHKLYLVEIGPFNFLVHTKVSSTDQKIFMAVQMFGTKTSASKWNYEFHVYSKSQPRRKYLYTDICESTSTPIDDIFKGGNCAVVPINFAKGFENNGALTYKFYVKKSIEGNEGRNQRGRGFKAAGQVACN